jgi:DNA-binding SARP family transcriptional activator
VQYYVSQLRKALGAERIVTRAPGYSIRIEAGELDLDRFEELAQRGGADGLRDALALWRGPPLADLAYEAFAQPEIARLEELRLTAVEQRIDAELALGQHGDLVGELERLVAQEPLRERLRGQLMLALYRSGRQAEALETFQETRRTLVDELGIEPGPALQELERAILRQDPSLDIAVAAPVPERSILVAARHRGNLDGLLAVAEPLAQRPARELILVSLVAGQGELESATRALNEQRAALVERGAAARATAFTSDDAGDDLVRLAVQQDVDLVLVEAPPELLGTGPLPPHLEQLLAEAPCDVAMLARSGPLEPGRAVLVPFGGAEHDWAAVEIAGWIAGALRVPLRLLGTIGEPGKRDASRLLASASLIVQRALGVPTESLLAERGASSILEAAAEAALVVAGLSERWRQEGLGETRTALARDVQRPTLFVKRGLRPGGVAPQASLTRFTWSIAPAQAPRLTGSR